MRRFNPLRSVTRVQPARLLHVAGTKSGTTSGLNVDNSCMWLGNAQAQRVAGKGLEYVYLNILGRLCGGGGPGVELNKGQ